MNTKYENVLAPLKLFLVIGLILFLSNECHAAYAVQVGAFRDEGHASELASALIDAGVPVFLEKSSSRFHRVRVGPYESSAKAKEVGEYLKRQMHLSYFIARGTFSAPIQPPTQAAPIKNDLNDTIPQERIKGHIIEEGVSKDLLDEALSLVGTPYVWAGDSLREGGFDCSGFVYYLMTSRGYKMGRRARDQYEQGEAIDRLDIAPGDLVFFRTYFNGPSHVGIYIGENRFCHASSAQGAVTVDELKGYYDERYLGARRIISSSLIQ